MRITYFWSIKWAVSCTVRRAVHGFVTTVSENEEVRNPNWLKQPRKPLRENLEMNHSWDWRTLSNSWKNFLWNICVWTMSTFIHNRCPAIKLPNCMWWTIIASKSSFLELNMSRGWFSTTRAGMNKSLLRSHQSSTCGWMPVGLSKKGEQLNSSKVNN